MNPNETLRKLRELISDLPNFAVGDEPAYELAELFEALDGWLTNGGFLPTDWANAVDPKTTNEVLRQFGLKEI